MSVDLSKCRKGASCVNRDGAVGKVHGSPSHSGLYPFWVRFGRELRTFTREGRWYVEGPTRHDIVRVLALLILCMASVATAGSSWWAASAYRAPAGGGSAPVETSYANAGGSGNRTSTVAVVSTVGQSGSPYILIDGNRVGVGYYFTSSAVTGKWVRFDFAAARVIDELHWIFGPAAGVPNGTWRVEAGNATDSWATVSADFTVAALTTNKIVTLTGNPTAYRYYRLLGVSGNATDLSWQYEMEFKISAP